MISIYCSEKLDGLASAAIALRHATLSKLPAHFAGFLHQDTLHEELIDMANLKGQLIFILDISFSPEDLPFIETITASNKIIYWNTTDKESIIIPSKITDASKENKSSAELTCSRFIPLDFVAKQLATLAHQIKYWQLGDERALKLQDIITFGYDPKELLEHLAKGILWTDKFETFHCEHNAKKIIAFEELMRTLAIKPYLSYRFGFALASHLLSSPDACQKILDSHAGVDVAIALYRDGRIALRRRDNCQINVKNLAELFGGGGQPYAAGARLKTTVTKDTFEQALFNIDQAFKNHYLQSSP
ncbi:hypothetical protein J4219_01285 [Candidatus Woesearchaeota archaeon]|nr:hypothetical protein [Candidatus Woesearchaeota archaeon]